MKAKGKLVLMGSGEMTSTMVEVHKMLLSDLPSPPSAVFLDTPAGFQLNAEQIGTNAIAYFRKHIGCHMEIASYRSSDTTSEIDAALACQRLREADYMLMGPGSPTYTVNHLGNSHIPEIITDNIRQGGCLVAASAAALTAGRFTLPVYEIYKVGQPLHWVEGLDFLKAFGLHMIVIPHWNNAEGGTHDTSRCFMGLSRFTELTSMLDDPLPILGLDEHTAIVINFASGTFQIHGLGTVVLQHLDTTQKFISGKTYPMDLLLGKDTISSEVSPSEAKRQPPTPLEHSGFWTDVHKLEDVFLQSITESEDRKSTNALLELDRLIWQAEGNRENPEIISQARELFREQLAEFGARTTFSQQALTKLLQPLVENLLSTRQHLRENGQFEAGDALRDALAAAGITVVDTDEGYRWQLSLKEKIFLKHNITMDHGQK